MIRLLAIRTRWPVKKIRWADAATRSPWSAPRNDSCGWDIEVKTGKRRAPVGQHPPQPPAREVFFHLLFDDESDADVRQRRLQQQPGVIHDKRAVDRHGKSLLALVKCPFVALARRGLAPTDAAVLQQILWMRRFAVPLKIVRRGDDGETQIRRQAHRTHIVVQILAEPNTGVKALLDDVGKPFVRHHLQRNAGVLAGQPPQMRHDGEIDRRTRRVDAHQAAWPFAKRIQALQRGVDVGKGRHQLCQQMLTGLRRRDVAGGTVQQAKPTCASSSRRVWVSVGGVTPNRAAARRTVRCMSG